MSLMNLSWGFNYQSNGNLTSFTNFSTADNLLSLGSTSSFSSGLMSPIDSIMSSITGLNNMDYGNPYGLDFSNGQNVNSQFAGNYGSSAVAYAGPNGTFAAASSGNSFAGGQVLPYGNQPQYGQQQNYQNQTQQNPMMQMMQMMMQFFMQMIQMLMQMMGMNPQQMGFGNQQNYNYNNSPSQMAGLYNNNGGGATATATAGPGGASAAASTGGSNNAGYVGQSAQPNAPVNSRGLASPVQGRVSSEFGMRTHPITGQRKMHSGIDIAAPGGTRVNSMANGKVVFAGKRGGYGNMIIVDHGNGVTTRYAHLSSINVQPGQQINAGQHIGGVGSTGASTGNHLHFEVRENGNAVNPRKYINI